jgi:hypothetical protein
MENHLTRFLLENGWVEMRPLNFINEYHEGVTLFFDTSNQIEYYNGNNRIETWYISTVDELIAALTIRNILEK